MHRRARVWYAATVFLGAFLLFQVQPLLGRMVLPWFGGTASVWTACLLFFQAALLAGYLYAHALVRRLAAPRQAVLHLLLLLAALAFLPLGVDAAWKPADPGRPVARILALLTASVGLPYLLLAATGPLLQAWFHREQPGRSPYPLYALSNLGSMLALLSYPVLVEPFLTLRSQARLWSAGFALYVLLAAGLAWRSRATRAEPSPGPPAEATPPSDFGQYLLWGLLAAAPAILLMAFTAHLTANVAPVPLLWIIPLALYLLSFILCFDGRGWYRRGLFLPLALVGLAAVLFLMTESRHLMSPRVQVPVFSLALFAVCMCAHGELVRLKPHASRLTGFYLALAAGGAVGGLFVGILAPLLLQARQELPVGVLLFVGLVFVLLLREPREGRRLRAWPFAACGFLFILAGALSLEGLLNRGRYRVSERNFYGVLRVLERGEGLDRERFLLDGAIMHGSQYLDPERRRWPTAYFGLNSGVGRALQRLQAQGPVRVGVIGLGAGTLAVYGHPGDRFRFYEINPAVAALARREFHYLSDSAARVEIVLGDGRLSLEREAGQALDLLVMDAFSGDAIPIHLLTREAMALYFRHLKPGGLLAVNASNRFVDIAPVLRDAAERAGLAWVQLYPARLTSPRSVVSRWFLMGREPAQLRGLATEELVALPVGDPLAWTDDFSSLWGALTF